MPSKASRQFNELTNGIKNGTSTGSVPKVMRDEYAEKIKASIEGVQYDINGNPRNPMEIYDEDGRSIGIKGNVGPGPHPMGKSGVDGLGIANATLNEQGDLTINLENGNTVIVTKVDLQSGHPDPVGEPGEQGVDGIADQTEGLTGNVGLIRDYLGNKSN